MSQFARPTHPPEFKNRSTWSGLRGCALALALASAGRKAEGPLLVLTNDARESELLVS